MRRGFAPALVLLLSFALVAAACGDDDAPATTTAAPTTQATTTEAPTTTAMAMETVTLQLDWFPNTNHTGFYVADAKGWYADAGIELEILPYSGASGDQLVAEGVADFAVSFQNSITLSRPAGVEAKAVGAILQHSAEAISVLPDSGIESPKDLDGKTYAGFGGSYEVPVLQAVIRADGGEGDFDFVVLDTAAYEAVYNGAADFTIPFITWEGVEATLNNQPLRYFYYEDYGVPDIYSVIVVAGDSLIESNPDLIARFMDATRQGFEWGVENPDEAAQILIDANPGVFTDEELVFESQKLMAESYFLDDNGQWGNFDLARFAEYSSFLYNAGIINDERGNPLTEEPDWSEFIYTDWHM